MRKTAVYMFLFLFTISFIHTASAYSPVELLPQRIIFDGRERTTTLRMMNRNPTPGTYRIETIMLRQNINGGSELVTEPTPEEQKILKMFRFSPRQVKIPANSVQTVRIMARKPANLEPGEYRAHLRVTNVPEEKKQGEPSQELAIQIDFVVATSLPLIMRHGKTDIDLNAGDASPEYRKDGKEAVKMRIIADGNRSAFMDAALYYKDTLLGERKGFAVYQPNGQRDVSFPLKADLPPSGSSLKLILHDREKDERPLLGEIPVLLKY